MLKNELHDTLFIYILIIYKHSEYFLVMAFLKIDSGGTVNFNRFDQYEILVNSYWIEVEEFLSQIFKVSTNWFLHCHWVNVQLLFIAILFIAILFIAINYSYSNYSYSNY
jgi:hypothetical protein